MQIATYTDRSSFDHLSDDWADLLSRAAVNSVFSTPQYLRTWWQYLGDGELRVVTFRNDHGTLVGLAPLYLKNCGKAGRCLVFIGCVDVSDYLDFIVDRDHLELVYSALADFLDDTKDIEWQQAYLCSIPERSPSREYLLNLGTKRSWNITLRQEEACPVVRLPDSWEGYLASLKKKQRHEIRRKLRKAQNEADVRWYVLDQREGLDSALETFIDLHQKSSTDKEGFWDESLKNFFKAVARTTAESGWLRLYLLEINAHPAASLLCFHYQDEILVYNSGYDPEQYGHLSPGNLVIAYSIQDAIGLGSRRYDFLRGAEEYKFRLGGQPEAVYAIRINRASTRQ
jgi:CelD/BcsL family acetyltransferase involved in cellulose biosynthesis